jgi:hypothetical protein
MRYEDRNFQSETPEKWRSSGTKAPNSISARLKPGFKEDRFHGLFDLGSAGRKHEEDGADAVGAAGNG